MCQVLQVPRSTYYQSFHKLKSSRELENEAILVRIKAIHAKSKQRYGAPKIHEKLLAEGFKFSLKRVQRLMQKEDIRSIIVKKYRSASSKDFIDDRENILDQDFSTTTINEKWVGDIAYIHTLKDGWCYLGSFLDLHTKKVVGYSFAKTMTNELVLQALRHAIDVQRPKEGLILHTDLGSQYTSEAFGMALKQAMIRHSFSRKGCPYDNACIESFHATLKKEEVYRSVYVDFEHARLSLFEYIESWYNRERIHGSIHYLTPQQLEDTCRSHAA